jgi:multiple sugar transport system substrate-binding protein
MRKRRITIAAAALAVAGSLIAGCSSSASKSSGPVTVTMWARAATSPITKALVKKFNATHSDIHVDLTVLPLNTEDAKFAAAVRAGSVPDIFGMNDISIPQFVRTGALRPMSSFVNSLPFKSQLNQGQIKLATYNGQLYAVPDMLDLSIMWYNKTLFRRAGLNPNDPPKNAAQIIADSKKISALGGGVKGFSFGGDCGGCMVFAIEPMISATGQQLLTGPVTSQTANIQNNNGLKAVLQFLRTIWTGNLAPASDRTQDGSTFGADFLAGKVGIEPNGLGTIEAAAQKASFQLGAAPIPGPNGSYSTFTGGDEFVLPNAGHHQEQAETFIKWALQPAQQSLYPANGYTPVRNDMLTPALKKKYPFFAVGLQAATRGYAPSSIAFQSLFSNTGPWGPIFQGAVFGGNISGALKTGQSQFAKILKTVQ